MLNRYIIDEKTTQMTLPYLDNPILFDTDDIMEISPYKWTRKMIKGDIFIETKQHPDHVSLFLHRHLMSVGHDRQKLVVFKNKNRLDFRRENLAIKLRSDIVRMCNVSWTIKPQSVFYDVTRYIGKYFVDYYVADYIKDGMYMCLHNGVSEKRTLDTLFRYLRKYIYSKCYEFDKSDSYGKFLDADVMYLGPQLTPHVEPTDYPINTTPIIAISKNTRLVGLGIGDVWFRSGNHVIVIKGMRTVATYNKLLKINKYLSSLEITNLRGN